MDLYNNGDLRLSPRSQNLDLPLSVSSSPIQDIHTDLMQSLTTPADQSENPNSQPHVDSVADVQAMADPELLACNIIEPMQKSKTEKTKDSNEKSEAAADFECNICYEVVKDPVVTCCGHLFCWPCLYCWLHVHCKINKACPVCKRKVSESLIVPIYGRGSSEGNEKSGGLKIPPRPNGVEISQRQQHQRQLMMYLREAIRHIELQRRVPFRSDDEPVGIVSADNRRDSEPVRSQTSGSNAIHGTNAAHVSDASAEPSTTGDSSMSMTAMDNVQRRQRRRMD